MAKVCREKYLRGEIYTKRQLWISAEGATLSIHLSTDQHMKVREHPKAGKKLLQKIQIIQDLLHILMSFTLSFKIISAIARVIKTHTRK